MARRKFGNLTKVHIIKAIKDFDRNPELLSAERRVLKKYKLCYEGKEYPPKGIISLACKETIGKILPAGDFSSVPETNNLLLNLGFKILSENDKSLKKGTTTSQSRKSTISFTEKEIEKDRRVEEYEEGKLQRRLTNIYERSPQARQQCIAKYGTVCVICKFNFANQYGKVGEGFIHVHHLRQVATGKRKVDPIKDLRPVCPNCHAMIHQRKKPYTIEEVKEFRRKAKRQTRLKK